MPGQGMASQDFSPGLKGTIKKIIPEAELSRTPEGFPVMRGLCSAAGLPNTEVPLLGRKPQTLTQELS